MSRKSKNKYPVKKHPKKRRGLIKSKRKFEQSVIGHKRKDRKRVEH